MIITDKAQMYALLKAGRLGNTIPQYGSIEEWRASGDPDRYSQWGVRTKSAGGPCRLNCPVEEVEDTVLRFRPHLPNISVMISAVGQVTWLGDIWDSPTGLVCCGFEYPERIHDWRQLMGGQAQQKWEGVAARSLLRRHLNSNSYDDLMLTIEGFPSHVVELSTMDVCFGVLPHRNAIVWEVRCDTALYELDLWGGKPNGSD